MMNVLAASRPIENIGTSRGLRMYCMVGGKEGRMADMAVLNGAGVGERTRVSSAVNRSKSRSMRYCHLSTEKARLVSWSRKLLTEEPSLAVPTTVTVSPICCSPPQKGW